VTELEIEGLVEIVLDNIPEGLTVIESEIEGLVETV